MKQLTGEVVSTKMKDTIVVKVERFWKHPLLEKRVRRSKRYHVHALKSYEVGQKVIIQETKPISKRKRWKVISTIN